MIYEARDIVMGKINNVNAKLTEISKEGWKIISVVPYTARVTNIHRDVVETQYARVFLEKKESQKLLNG